jgi:hypothetical protein
MSATKVTHRHVCSQCYRSVHIGVKHYRIMLNAVRQLLAKIHVPGLILNSVNFGGTSDPTIAALNATSEEACMSISISIPKTKGGQAEACLKTVPFL